MDKGCWQHLLGPLSNLLQPRMENGPKFHHPTSLRRCSRVIFSSTSTGALLLMSGHRAYNHCSSKVTHNGAVIDVHECRKRIGRGSACLPAHPTAWALRALSKMYSGSNQALASRPPPTTPMIGGKNAAYLAR